MRYEELKFFRNFTQDEIKVLVKVMIPVTYGEGEFVIKEGEASNVLMLIIQGRAKVVKMINENNHKIISILEDGDIFGEMSFFDKYPHNASVIAHTSLSLLAMSKQDFEYIVEKHPKIAFKMLIRIIQVCSERIRNLNEEIKQLGNWCLTLRNQEK